MSRTGDQFGGGSEKFRVSGFALSKSHAPTTISSSERVHLFALCRNFCNGLLTRFEEFERFFPPLQRPGRHALRRPGSLFSHGTRKRRAPALVEPIIPYTFCILPRRTLVFIQNVYGSPADEATPTNCPNWTPAEHTDGRLTDRRIRQATAPVHRTRPGQPMQSKLAATHAVMERSPSLPT